MITKEYILKHRDEIVEIGRRHGASNLRIFGSVARGEADESSDVDFLAHFEAERSLFDQGELAMDLMDLLGVKVDVVSDGGVRGRWRDYLAREAIPL